MGRCELAIVYWTVVISCMMFGSSLASPLYRPYFLNSRQVLAESRPQPTYSLIPVSMIQRYPAMTASNIQYVSMVPKPFYVQDIAHSFTRHLRPQASQQMPYGMRLVLEQGNRHMPNVRQEQVLTYNDRNNIFYPSPQENLLTPNARRVGQVMGYNVHESRLYIPSPQETYHEIQSQNDLVDELQRAEIEQGIQDVEKFQAEYKVMNINPFNKQGKVAELQGIVHILRQLLSRYQPLVGGHAETGRDGAAAVNAEDIGEMGVDHVMDESTDAGSDDETIYGIGSGDGEVINDVLVGGLAKADHTKLADKENEVTSDDADTDIRVVGMGPAADMGARHTGKEAVQVGNAYFNRIVINEKSNKLAAAKREYAYLNAANKRQQDINNLLAKNNAGHENIVFDPTVIPNILPQLRLPIKRSAPRTSRFPSVSKRRWYYRRYQFFDDLASGLVG